jgi:hypothetical protein
VLKLQYLGTDGEHAYYKITKQIIDASGRVFDYRGKYLDFSFRIEQHPRIYYELGRVMIYLRGEDSNKDDWVLALRNQDACDFEKAVVALNKGIKNKC